MGSFIRHIFFNSARGADATAGAVERARALLAHGDHAKARAACEGILAHDPQNAAAHRLLGMACGALGDLDRAFDCLGRAVKLDPSSHEAHFGLGNVQWMRHDLAAAAESYRRALALNPDSAQAHYSLGMVLRMSAEPRGAAQHLARAVALDPALRAAAIECVHVQIQNGQVEAALEVAEGALRREPSAGDLHALLGFVRLKLHQPQAALECLAQAQALGHDNADLWCSRGCALQELGRIPEALEAFNHALGREPDHAVARFHRALARLGSGDFQSGWPDYETRLISVEHPKRPQTHSRWGGSALTGRTLMVYGEQGLGDEIMFASCLPEVIRQADRCVIECNPKLARLFQRSFPQATVVAAASGGGGPAAADRIDCEVPIGSLPLYLRRSRSDFPRHQGYLKADPQRVAAWRDRLASLGPGIKVGVSWRGGTHVSRSPLRSIPLDQWLPILGVAGAQFVSLQYGACGDELDALASNRGRRIVYWEHAIDDYDETAALVSALDLVVSVCTAVIHLTGALGRPVWIMAPYSPEWRYGFTGTGMIWYPSARLFRQPAFGEWPPVIAAVARDLKALAPAAAEC